jgi:hypothetical protein
MSSSMLSACNDLYNLSAIVGMASGNAGRVRKSRQVVEHQIDSNKKVERFLKVSRK